MRGKKPEELRRKQDAEKENSIMFAPNVWTFNPPNTLITHKYSESNQKHAKQICKRIHNHPFNRVVSANVYLQRNKNPQCTRMYCLHRKLHPNAYLVGK